jgi:hypothetical protein
MQSVHCVRNPLRKTFLKAPTTAVAAHAKCVDCRGYTRKFGGRIDFHLNEA